MLFKAISMMADEPGSAESPVFYFPVIMRIIGMIRWSIGDAIWFVCIKCMTIAFGSLDNSSGMLNPFCFAIPTGSLLSCRSISA